MKSYQLTLTTCVRLMAVAFICLTLGSINTSAEQSTTNLTDLLTNVVVKGNPGQDPEPAQSTEVVVEGKNDQAPEPAQSAEPIQLAQVDQADQSTPDQPLPLLQPDASGVLSSMAFKGDITDFIKMLSVTSGRNIIPTRQVKGHISVHLTNITAMEALDAVLPANGFAYVEDGALIRVYTQKELAQKIAAERKTVHRIFHLNYISAKDIQTLISPLLSGEAMVSTSPDAGVAQSDGGEKWAGSNFIIVEDFPEYIEKIEKLIAKVDVRPAQVLVEATILVASLDDTNELGIDLNVLGGVSFKLNAGGAKIGVITDSSVGSDTGGDTTFSSSVGTGGLSIGFTNNNVGVFIRALESITDVVALGNPKVLTLNRQQGKVIVGNTDGYITTEVSQTTATQKVEFFDTGTQLTFRPFVMDDGYIRMELTTEDSDGGVSVEGGFTLPSKTTASVTSNILVKDGNTIVIGGLFRERTSLTRSQVPLLGNIPILGQLFSGTSDKNTKEEVIFLITPHIVEDAVDYAAAQEALENTNRLMIGAREGMMGTARDRIAGAHFQRAQKDRNDGKLNWALWHANMATNASPMFLDALYLSDKLQSRKLYQAQYSSMRTFMNELIEKE